MPTVFNECKCGGKKDVTAKQCRRCFIGESQAKRHMNKTSHRPSTKKICMFCYGEFSSRHHHRRCTICKQHISAGISVMGVILLAIKRCKDPIRKEKIQLKFESFRFSDPLGFADLARKEREIADMVSRMTPITRQRPQANVQLSSDGYAVHQRYHAGYRCPRCGGTCQDRNCRSCELQIRGF